MSDDDSTSRRDLIARVATLELLVTDLIDALWQVDPRGMDRLADEAGRDVDAQQARPAFPVGPQERDRLYSVLEARRRMLRRNKADA